ncbi:MAG: flavodoxin-dependent (E)-4-hydroxy-3-methylbut-2-enyl-diphosphate synthase [Chloroflexi bacterium]|nr:flavodoxin-dependent (E)-4-hydroxy-3-methylbut-2-enyl-diphosphate synthase [Chloroflexota bacterium]
MIERRPTRQIMIGNVPVGGDAPIAVQSMCSSDTRDIDATMAQINALEQAGCEIVRIAVPTKESAEAFGEIRKQTTIPLVADIHFDYRMALMSIEKGADKIRINPGNIINADGMRAVHLAVDAAKERGIPIRVGVNAGSIEHELLEKYGYPTPEAACESAVNHVHLLEDMGFNDIAVSVKFSDVPRMVEAYRLLSQRIDYPLHLGVTEAGASMPAYIKSAMGIGALLAEGIGDTIRVSLTTADKTDEVTAGFEILKALEIRSKGPMLTACPSCGRAQVDLPALALQVSEALKSVTKEVKVAVMGCAVNGPGEAADSDIAVVGGRGVGMLYIRGKPARRVPESQVIAALLEEIEAWQPESVN